MTGTQEVLNSDFAAHHRDGAGTADDRMRENTAFGETPPSFSAGNRHARATDFQMQQSSGSMRAQMVSFHVGDNTISGALAGNKLVTNTGNTYFVHTNNEGNYVVEQVNGPGSRGPAQEATLAVKPNAFTFDGTPPRNRPVANETSPEPIVRTPVVSSPDATVPQIVPTGEPVVRTPVVSRPDATVPQTLPTGEPVVRTPVVSRPDATVPQTLPTGEPVVRTPVVSRPDATVPQTLPTGEPVVRTPVVSGPCNDVIGPLPQNGPRIDGVGPLPQNGPRIDVVGPLPQNGPRIDGVGPLPQNGPRIDGVGPLPQNGPRIDGVGPLPQNGPRIDGVGPLPQNGPRIDVVGPLPQNGSRIDAINCIENRGASLTPTVVTGEKGRAGFEGGCGSDQPGVQVILGQPHPSSLAGQPGTQFDPAERLWNEQARVSIHPIITTDIHGAPIPDRLNCTPSTTGIAPESLIAPSAQSFTAPSDGSLAANRRSIAGLDLSNVETRQFIGEVIKQLQTLKIESSDANTVQLSQTIKGLDPSRVDKLQDYLVQGMDGTKQLTVAEMISKLTVILPTSDSSKASEGSGKEVSSKKDAPTPAILDATLGSKTTESHAPAAGTVEPKVVEHGGSAHNASQASSATPATEAAHGPKREHVKSDVEALPTTRPESVKVDLQGVPATRPEGVKIDLQVIPATKPENVKVDLDVILATKSEIMPNQFDPRFTTRIEIAPVDLAPSTERADYKPHQLSSIEIKNQRNTEEEKERQEKEEKRHLAQEAKARQDVAFAAILEQRRLNGLKEKVQKEQEKIVEQEKKKQDDNKRRRYVVRHNDTLQSIATTQLRNVKLTSLIHSINRIAIPFEIEDGEPVYSIHVGQVIWLPSNNEIAQALATIARDELRGKSKSAHDELESRFGSNWDGTVTPEKATKTCSDEELAAIELKRRNIESFLGKITVKKADPNERIQYTVRLGDTLKSIALSHPAMVDLSLWKLLAQINHLSTEADEKGSAIAKLRRGSVIVLPKQWEIENYRSSMLSEKSQTVVLDSSNYITASR